MTTGTVIANEILQLYKRFSDKVDFKNVQRRVYDALNVLSAMDIIKKYKNRIYYNEDNEFIDDDVHPSTKPDKITVLHDMDFSLKDEVGAGSQEPDDTSSLA